MQASQKCYDFIKRNEGFSLKAYWDKFGKVWTIGWGTIRHDDNSPIKADEVITEAQAQHFLEREVGKVEDAINEAVKAPLTQAEYDCLVDLFYNIGTGWCTGRGHTQAGFIGMLNAGKYSAVPAQLLLFERDTSGHVVSALQTRRRWEAQMWLAGESDHSYIVAATSQNTAGEMPQAVKEQPVTPEVVQAVKSSWTLRSAFVGLLATITGWLDNLFGFSKGVAQGFMDVQNDLSPWQGIMSIFWGHAGHVTAFIAASALIFVVVRKFNAVINRKVGG